MPDNMQMDGMDEMPEKPMGDSGEKNSVMLSADMFGGMMPKKGQKMTFCCTADPDSEGNVAGYFEKSGGMDMDGKGDWEKDFLKEMSPRNKEMEAM